MNAGDEAHSKDATLESPLSAEYRRLMRWYPKRWRVANEEAMLGALLDQADGERRDEVTAAERTAIIRGGLRLQFGVSRRSPSRLTLLLGGSALILATVIPLLGRVVFVWPQLLSSSWLYFSWQPLPERVSAVLFVIAFAILALGLGKEPGIAGRSTVGKVALTLFPVAYLIGFLAGSTPLTPETSKATLTLVSVLIWSSSLLWVAALIAASIVVYRAGIVLGIARWGLIVLAVVTAAMLTLSHIPNPAIGEIAFWAYPVVLLVQLATGSLYILGGTASLRQRLAVGPTQA